jgi:hypothetical protein
MRKGGVPNELKGLDRVTIKKGCFAMPVSLSVNWHGKGNSDKMVESVQTKVKIMIN